MGRDITNKQTEDGKTRTLRISRDFELWFYYFNYK